MWLERIKTVFASPGMNEMENEMKEKVECLEAPYWQGGKMLILVISDNHGKIGELQDLLERVKPDLLFHLGDSEIGLEALRYLADCPVVAVPGNCDSVLRYKGATDRSRTVQLTEHLKAFLTHGNLYHVNYGTSVIAEAARKEGCNLVLFGHTHVPLLEYQEDLVLLNPGSLNCPRQGDGRGTYALIEIDHNGAAHYTSCKYKRLV